MLIISSFLNSAKQEINAKFKTTLTKIISNSPEEEPGKRAIHLITEDFRKLERLNDC